MALTLEEVSRWALAAGDGNHSEYAVGIPAASALPLTKLAPFGSRSSAKKIILTRFQLRNDFIASCYFRISGSGHAVRS